MKICKIYIKGFQQFQDVELDFTNPETGEPLDKICFIGSNGTGKSTLLRLIAELSTRIRNSLSGQSNWMGFSMDKESKVLYKIINNNKIYYLFYYYNEITLFLSNSNILSDDYLIQKIISVQNNLTFREELSLFIITIKSDEFLLSFQFKDNSKDLVIYSPAEGRQNGYKDINDVPATNVNEALELMKSFPVINIVSPDHVNLFWKLLVYNIRKKAEERDAFENLPESLAKTKQQLIEEFDRYHPKILNELASIWDEILNKAGLYFDVKGASNPYQLTDNLKAYVKLENSKLTIPYSELSTGIRNYIFRVGHIFSLYFNREIDRGFLLVDEPENSLYPDFLFNLIDTYQRIALDKRGQNNTQMFFATHNPIIAAQFQPYERIILDWNEDGSVNAKKGISPVGDDPNDILVQDFEVSNLLGAEGIKMWEKYVSLKQQLIKASNDDTKQHLIHEIEKIGSLYNFS